MENDYISRAEAINRLQEIANDFEDARDMDALYDADGYCAKTGREALKSGNGVKRGRPDWCPLIELPEHGDLIDRSKLLDEFIRMQKLMDDRGHEFSCSFMSSGMEISTEWYCVEDVVNAAKTIIPASGGEP